MLTLWQQATLDGLRRYAARHASRLIRRSELIAEELSEVAHQVGSTGRTPAQTLSRVLQELRRLGLLHHVDRGIDLLLDQPVSVELEDLPDRAIDIALRHEGLRISDTPTADVVVLARSRRGQTRLRQHTLANYQHRCGLCDVIERDLLIASHIVRWCDDPDARGRLSNVLCLCRMHDALYEVGYISLSDDLTVLRRPVAETGVVAYLQRTADELRAPAAHRPAATYLRRHRHRTGFELV